jgi:hypothetical protein
MWRAPTPSSFNVKQKIQDKGIPDLCGQATGGRAHFGGLQHLEGFHTALVASAARWLYTDFREDLNGQGHYARCGELRQIGSS